MTAVLLMPNFSASFARKTSAIGDKRIEVADFSGLSGVVFAISPL